MIGEQDLDAIELQISHGHVVYTGGAKGTDELVEQMAKQFGMQVEVLVPPNHPRAQFVTPSTVEVLMLANPHLHQALRNWGNGCPVIFTRFNCCNAIIKLLKKRIPSMLLASWKRMVNA